MGLECPDMDSDLDLGSNFRKVGEVGNTVRYARSIGIVLYSRGIYPLAVGGEGGVCTVRHRTSHHSVKIRTTCRSQLPDEDEEQRQPMYRRTDRRTDRRTGSMCVCVLVIA